MLGRGAIVNNTDSHSFVFNPNSQAAPSSVFNGRDSLLLNCYNSPPATPALQDDYNKSNQLNYDDALPSGYSPTAAPTADNRLSVIKNPISQQYVPQPYVKPANSTQFTPLSDTVSVVSDFSDTASMVSVNTVQGSSLPDRMDRMKTRCKRVKEPQTAYNAAQFIVQNVQYLEKDTQVPYCEVAVKAFRKLSNSYGHVDSTVALAHLYVRGIPGFQSGHKPDYAKAFANYHTASKKDHTEGSFHLALCYEHGLGTQQSSSRAFQWYRKAGINN